MPMPTVRAVTDDWTLEQLLARLSRQDTVEGILLMGTTASGALTPTSDYDVLLVLSDPPAPLRIVNTWVDGRLTEIYCTTASAVVRVAAGPAGWPDASEEGALAEWLRTGRIVHDRTERLARSQEAVRASPPPRPPDAADVYEAWRKIGYNVAQMRRYLESEDPAGQTSVDLRLLYSVFEVVLHYFTVRGLPWRGEKPAVRHLEAHDPAYLDRLRECLAEPDRTRKVELYEELAQLTLAPVGGLWGGGQTVVAAGAGWGAGPATPPTGTVQSALGYWRELIGDR